MTARCFITTSDTLGNLKISIIIFQHFIRAFQVAPLFRLICPLRRLFKIDPSPKSHQQPRKRHFTNFLHLFFFFLFFSITGKNAPPTQRPNRVENGEKSDYHQHQSNPGPSGGSEIARSANRKSYWILFGRCCHAVAFNFRVLLRCRINFIVLIQPSLSFKRFLRGVYDTPLSFHTAPGNRFFFLEA